MTRLSLVPPLLAVVLAVGSSGRPLAFDQGGALPPQNAQSALGGLLGTRFGGADCLERRSIVSRCAASNSSTGIVALDRRDAALEGRLAAPLTAPDAWLAQRLFSRLALGPGPFSFDGTTQAQFTQMQDAWTPHGSLGALYGQRIAAYVGGATSDVEAPVIGAVRGYNQTRASVGRSVEASGLFVTDNSSWDAQGVGVTGQCRSHLGGRCWGGVLEAHELPRRVVAAAGQTAFDVANGYRPGAAIVVKNGALLKRGADYRDDDGKRVILAAPARAGDDIRIYLGDPMRAVMGVEIDVFASPGQDKANPMSGNRVGVGLFGYRGDKSVDVDTHIGSGLNIIADPADPRLTMDRGIGFQGRFVNAIDLTAANVSVSGSAVALKADQNIAIGTRSRTFQVELSGDKTGRPDGVMTRWTDTSAPAAIDMRAGASGGLGIASVGAFSNHDLALWAHGGVTARVTAAGVVPERAGAAMGDASHRWDVYARALTLTPPSSATPKEQGDLVIEKTSDTQITFRLRGSDGVVRSATLTLR